MQVDEERVQKVFEKQSREHNNLRDSLVRISSGINFDSPDQIREYLYETLKVDPPTRFGRPWLTDSGKPSASVDAVKSLKPKTAKARKFIKLYLQFKKLSGDLTKYLNKFKSACKEQDGHLESQINQTVTKTHRTSSSGRGKYKYNFQNFNRNFKPLFKARRESWIFTERDYPQLEFAVAGDLGQDRRAISDILEGRDLHSETANVLSARFKHLTGEARAKSRTAAKEHTFKPLYGGTSGTPAQKRYYKHFKKRYQELTKVQDGWISECLEHKKFRNPFNGLVFYYPNVRVTQTGYIVDNEKIRNIAIQSTATADVVLIGLVLLFHLLGGHGLNSYIVNTVHDSIEMEEDPEEEEIINKLANWALLDGVYWVSDKLYDYQWRVPLSITGEIEVHRAEHWSDSPEWRDEWLN